MQWVDEETHADSMAEYQFTSRKWVRLSWVVEISLNPTRHWKSIQKNFFTSIVDTSGNLTCQSENPSLKKLVNEYFILSNKPINHGTCKFVMVASYRHSDQWSLSLSTQPSPSAYEPTVQPCTIETSPGQARLWSNRRAQVWLILNLGTVNYNDLTATSLEPWLVRGIIPKWP